MGNDDMEGAEEAGTVEERRYEKAYRETRRILDESIDLISQFEHFEENPNRKNALALRLEKLAEKRDDLVAAHLAFHQGRAVMAPPSTELVEDIVATSKEVVELTIERTTAFAVLALATKGLQQFAKIQDI